VPSLHPYGEHTRYIARNPEPRCRVSQNPNKTQQRAALKIQNKEKGMEGGEETEGKGREGKGMEGREGAERTQETPGPFPPGNV
jgi:hypothetical protein